MYCKFHLLRFNLFGTRALLLLASVLVKLLVTRQLTLNSVYNVTFCMIKILLRVLRLVK